MRRVVLALLIAACAGRPESAPPVVVQPPSPAGPSASAGTEPVVEAPSDAAATATTTAAVSPSDAGSGVITLQRTICFGMCPSYTVSIHEDGLVEYVGDRFVHTHGNKTWRVPPADARALFDRFAAEGFMTLNMPTSCAAIETDHPSAITTLWRSGSRHSVDHYYGNTCAPKALMVLEKAVDEAARTKPVIECKPTRYCRNP